MKTMNEMKQAPGSGRSRKAGRSRKSLLKAKREVTPVVSVAGPEGGRAVMAGAAPQAINVPQETAKIKLEVSKMTPSQMLDLLTVVGTGMAATPVYATLPVLTDVNGARTALSALWQARWFMPSVVLMSSKFGSICQRRRKMSARAMTQHALYARSATSTSRVERWPVSSGRAQDRP